MAKAKTTEDRINNISTMVEGLRRMDILKPLVSYLLPLSRGYDFWHLTLEGRRVTLRINDWPKQYECDRSDMLCGFKIEWV